MEKWRKNKIYFLVTSIVTVLPMIIGIVLWKQLPDRVAIHFDRNSIPNGWSSKGFAVFGLPIFCLITHIVCTLTTLFDKKQENIQNKIIHLVFWICPVVSLVCGSCIYGYALSYPVNIGVFTEFFIGIIFVITGNYLPKCRQNYVIGIKVPWTLQDKENWNRTHRLAGWIWVPCGILLILDAFLHIIAPSWMVFLLFGIMIIIPIGYSFFYFLKQKIKQH